MIRLVQSEHDDPDFLDLAQRIVNGALTTIQIREVFLVHIDNWFDHKWLGWRSRKGEELRDPAFTPNRVFSEQHFLWDESTQAWKASPLPKPLHLYRPGRPWLAQPLDRFSANAAFIWYSGNTANNKLGSLMFYVSGAEGYSWYVSFRKTEGWTIADECHATRREILAFEERGRELAAQQETSP